MPATLDRPSESELKNLSEVLQDLGKEAVHTGVEVLEGTFQQKNEPPSFLKAQKLIKTIKPRPIQTPNGVEVVFDANHLKPSELNLIISELINKRAMNEAKFFMGVYKYITLEDMIGVEKVFNLGLAQKVRQKIQVLKLNKLLERTKSERELTEEISKMKAKLTPPDPNTPENSRSIDYDPEFEHKTRFSIFAKLQVLLLDTKPDKTITLTLEDKILLQKYLDNHSDIKDIRQFLDSFAMTSEKQKIKITPIVITEILKSISSISLGKTEREWYSYRKLLFQNAKAVTQKPAISLSDPDKKTLENFQKLAKLEINKLKQIISSLLNIKGSAKNNIYNFNLQSTDIWVFKGVDFTQLGIDDVGKLQGISSVISKLLLSGKAEGKVDKVLLNGEELNDLVRFSLYRIKFLQSILKNKKNNP
jgi:hypothetical protein